MGFHKMFLDTALCMHVIDIYAKAPCMYFKGFCAMYQFLVQ